MESSIKNVQKPASVLGDNSSSQRSQDTDRLKRLEEAIRRLIEERWSNYFPSRAGGPAPAAIIASPPNWPGFSVLLRFDLVFPGGAPAEHLIAKFRRETRHGAFAPDQVTSKALNRGRREFDELTRAHHHFMLKGNGLGVIRPLDYLENCNAALIERARGFDMAHWVNRRDSRLSLHLDRCGRWLRSFHDELHPATPGSWSVEAFRSGLLERRGRLLRCGVPSRTLDALIETILKSASLVSPQPVGRSLLHGDFKLRHIWATEDAIQVLDFGNIHEGDCCSDIAAFLVELIVLGLGKPWFDTARISAHATAFLGGYFDGQTLPEPLRFYVVDALLKKWERRLVRWSRHFVPIGFQKGLERLRVKQIVDRFYLDRWFRDRIDRALAAPEGL